MWCGCEPGLGRPYPVPARGARGRDVLRRAKNTRSRRNSTRLRRAERYGVYRAPGARRGRHFPRRLDILERSAAGPARSAAPEMRLNVSQSAGGRAPASSSSARTRQPHNGTKNQAVPGLRAAPLRHIFGSKPSTALRLGPGHRHAAKKRRVTAQGRRAVSVYRFTANLYGHIAIRSALPSVIPPSVEVASERA